MLSQSDIIVRPGSLTERLAAAAPPQPEPTPTTMAERFAPEAQKNGGGADGPGRPPADPPVMPGIVPPRARAGSSNRGLLVASMLVSLVPTAIILALMWQGAIRMPGSDRTRRSFSITSNSSTASRLRSPLRRCYRSSRQAEAAQGRYRADRAWPARGQDRRGARLRHHHQFSRRAAGTQRDRHPRHAGRRHLLARPALWRLGMEFDAGRDRRSQAQAAEDGDRLVRSPRRADGGGRHDPRIRLDQARHRS